MGTNLKPYRIRKEGHSSQEEFIDHLVHQVNKMMEVVERTAVGSQTTVVQANQSAVAGGSGGTGFIKTGDIVTVQKSVVGGVQITEIFDAPSFLLGIPINYAISDGMTSPQVLPPDDGTLTVSQMKLTPLQDGILTFSYRHI